MKVIKPGNVPSSIKVNCKTCNAILEVEASDIKYTPANYNARESINAIYQVTCPCCNETININEKKIPFSFEGKMKKQ